MAGMSKALELALKYYPKYWSKQRLVILVERGIMTPEEYKQVTGEDYVKA